MWAGFHIKHLRIMSPWDSFVLSFSPSISSFIPEMAAVLDILEDTPGNAGLLGLSLIQGLFHPET